MALLMPEMLRLLCPHWIVFCVIDFPAANAPGDARHYSPVRCEVQAGTSTSLYVAPDVTVDMAGKYLA